TTSPGIPKIKSIGDIGIASIKRVLRKNKSNECRASPFYEVEPSKHPKTQKNQYLRRHTSPGTSHCASLHPVFVCTPVCTPQWFLEKQPLGVQVVGLLSETQIKAAKPGPKEYMLNDGDNLYLRVRTTGKAWIYRYMKDSKPIKLGMGPYPEVTLAQARTKAYEANSQRANGLDPKEVREHLAEQTR
ncbi:Arm DNA-binding domain-containing protein, partial [Mesopusillimonas faecipullorum]|uniref:Arm DNA-binding domain-containing protein n=1 Tax=Mesopusillimonas faecipullorum TaxID=2755040 RepID=UPI001D00240A